MSLIARLKQQTVLMVLLLAGVCAPVGAVTVEGLYSAQVPVASSAPEDLKRGYAEGLRQVLLRVSGQGGFLERGGATSLLENAQSLVLSYQFLRAAETGGQDQLRMTFGAVGVNSALASIDAPVWGANRALTLAWIAVDERGGRQLLSQHGGQRISDRAPTGSAGTIGQSWSQAFAAAAVGRGLPLALPPADRGEGRRLLSEVWGQFMEPVKQASADLDHDLLAVVKIGRRGDQWEAAWRLEGSGFDTSDETVSGSSPESLAQKIVGAWADLQAERYAVAAGEVADSTRVDIVVDEVKSLQDYAAVRSALDKMTPVVGANPVRVTGDQMRMRVAFSGELSQLEQYIALDERFVEVQSQPRDTGSGVVQVEARDAVPVGTPTPVDGSVSGPAATDVSPAASGRDASAQVQQGGATVQYRPFAVEQTEEASEQAFESLYQTLRYRWQGSAILNSDASSN